ncbi:hypothetical protein [Paraburkholderia mimosarum]|uniref:hypothetical protein n=1 Tax=Paraburkholderia mimosarum TaxID=312026 RepID=UPI000422ED38|nr:hypothetical protein [Paraburkholderia mimosarum]
MKPRLLITSAILGAALAAPGLALAQGTGGGGSSGTGPDQGAGANSTYPAPTQGVEQNPSVTGSPNATTHRTHVKKHTKYNTKKPMNDTTNMPGADASSDTKGQ